MGSAAASACGGHGEPVDRWVRRHDMPTFLVWNVGRRALDGVVARLVAEHRVDVLLLVERPESDGSLLQGLGTLGSFARVMSHDRFGLYTRLADAFFDRLFPPETDERMDFWRFRLNGTVSVTLVAVHGPDRYHNPDDSDRRLFLAGLRENIQWAERQVGDKRTIVLGDFNANPFEESMGGIQGLHAIPVRHVGGKHHRTVGNRDYEFFFNPMWSCYGRRPNDPLATYYFTGSGEHEIFWHMIDQVVLRPDMLPFFPDNRLRILHRAGPVNLVTRFGYPDKAHASDHLPFLFQLSRRRRRRTDG